MPGTGDAGHTGRPLTYTFLYPRKSATHLAATAFLHGLALEEMDLSDMEVRDPQYPVITGVRAAKSI